MTLTTSR
uniref:Uncharacterized protein n=1 Tax=Macrostomum lignano TaxID=282301 RepID=A0A1Y9ETC9_9PLAT